MVRQLSIRFLTIVLLFSAVLWAFYIQLPALDEGYLNAGDDHIHAAYCNELKRIWEEEGRPLGWSRLYGAGAPIFLLRPPGFYQAVYLMFKLTGLTIEQSMKLLVVLGFCLYPVSVYLGSRLLGFKRFGALCAGCLAPIPISLWGHTIEAYHYLGVHKQLLAILLFPLSLGAFYQLVTTGRYGITYAVSFSLMSLTHPYMGYCFALTAPLIGLALFCADEKWNWLQAGGRAIIFSLPALLWCGLWLIPFITSPEMMTTKAYSAGRRANFVVVVLSTAELLRQFFLGGILDTTRFAGNFGGEHLWAWRDNSETLRFPLLTYLGFAGFLIAVFRSRKRLPGFLALFVMGSFILFAGPDDFPVLDMIPAAAEFQNVHAVFLFDFAIVLTAGYACQAICSRILTIRQRKYFWLVTLFAWGLILTGWLSVLHERHLAARKHVNVRPIHTHNGRFTQRDAMDLQWRQFEPVVESLNRHPEAGRLVGKPHRFEDAVLYNLIPLMVDRPFFSSAFEQLGGVYGLAVGPFRKRLCENYNLQQLFDIRFVLRHPYQQKRPLALHDQLETIVKNQFWQLDRVKGNHRFMEVAASRFIGFFGSETEWAELMELWLHTFADGPEKPMPIINFTHAGLKSRQIQAFRPWVEKVVHGSGRSIDPAFSDKPVTRLSDILTVTTAQMAAFRKKIPSETSKSQEFVFKFEPVEINRRKEQYRLECHHELLPVLVKRAFYRGWEARLDGNMLPIYRVSPGFQLLIIPNGEHHLELIYNGPNNWKYAKISFYSGFGALFLLLWLNSIWFGRKL